MFSTNAPRASAIHTARRIALVFGIAGMALLSPPLQGQSCQSNAIACENQLTGNAASEWDISGAGNSSLQGFATSISVNKGETVHFKVDTTYSTFQVNIYRLGYYGGRGARKIAALGSFPGIDQASCLTNASTGLVDCGNWLEAAAWTVPATAVSGIYLARLSGPSGGASHIVFVVRDDAAQADILFQTSDTTWQAYNQYGGNSLYVGGPGSNPGRAYKVSYNRPFTTRGTGPEDWLFNAEYPMVRWLEANGYNVSYFTGVDTDRSGATELLRHRIFLSVGHDEYWSGPQRTNVEAARNGGVHLAFFSGNEVFWKTRWEPSIDGTMTPYRTLVSYKETHANAKIDPADPPTWTGTWRDPRFSPPADGGRPENALTGTIFTVNCCNDTQTLRVTQAYASQPFWRNTRIATLAAGGSTTLTPGMLGYEWDENLNNGSRPAGLVTLSSTPQSVGAKLQDNGSTYAAGSATHSLVQYRHPSGALVFGAGTVQYSWGLDSTHDRGSAAADKAVQQATVNLFADMGGVQPATLQSGLVPGISDTTAPTVAITGPANASTVSGTLTVAATATDNLGVASVQFQLDGINLGAQVTASPYSVTWNTTSAANGSHTLKAVARDTAGNTATSTPVSVTVSNTPDTTAPTVAIAAPVDGATVSGSLTVSATATDNIGVAGVQFQLDGTNLGTEVIASPYSVTWNTASASNGLHTLKAVARDIAGNRTTSTPVSVTVSNTAAPPPTALTIDAIASGDRSTISSSIATTAFSTVASNDLLLAFVAADDASAGGQQVTTVAGAGLTWQLVVRSGTQRGTSEIWRAFSPSPLSSSVVTATLAQSAAASITVVAVSGADTSGSNGSGAIGAIKAASAASGAPTATLVTTRNNSWVFAVGNDWDNASARTVGTGQTMVHQYLATVGDTLWVQRATSTTPASGTTVTVNDTTPTADQYNLALCEIIPAAGADTTPPTVAITAPAGGASVSGTGVTLSATAADNVAVVGVQFKIDDVALGAEDTTAPYVATWDTTTAASGLHTLTASARDAAGNVAVSSPVIVTVSNDTTPPAVSLTTPTAGAVLSGAIVLSASATDNTAVAGVRFTLDGVNLGAEVTTPPYSISWDTQTAVNGPHTLTASARDAAGNMATSAPVTVVTQNTSTTPSVAITSPVNGAAVSGTITATAGASDPSGIAGVQFRVDGVDVGPEQIAAPYSISFTTISGPHILTAVARNTQGITATSAQVNVTASAGTTSAVTANGLQTFQTIDGIGVNINSLSWKNGELRPAIDMLADQMGVTSWRVVFDMVDWESQNDNADPNVSDATYYDALYSNQKFQNLWGTLHYLNQKGITHNVTLSFMGRVPTWMGGSVINTASEDEFVETISSLLAYARNTEHVVFDMVDPINEPDLDGIEGPQVDATQYTRILRKLATRLDAMALNDIRFLAPSVAHSADGVTTYIPAMLADSVVMAKVDHFSLHDYNATTSGADAAVKSSNRNFWMTEFAQPSDVTTFLAANASGLMIWEAYDSVYNHAILAGRGTVAPNDDAFAPALIAYNSTTGAYTPRAMFYQFAQLARYVPAGSIRVGTTGGASGVTLFAFYHAATGRVTVFGRNITASSVPLTITLANLAPASVMQSYETTLTTNFARGRDAVVSNGSLFYTAPVNSYFTLTNLPLSNVPIVTVPAVVGLPQASATTAITDAGLGVGTVSTQASASVAAGAVISQTPAANSQVPSGSAVNLVISTGPTLVTVPGVIGFPQTNATTAIVNAGLVVGTITTQSSTTVAVGLIIGQSLAANTQAIAGSAVDLVVSAGVTVPSVVGQPQSAATTTLTSAGLIAGAVTNQASASVPAGAVISQSPAANTQVSGGSAVNLVVSTGPAPVTVPSVVGLLQAAATTSITNASLVVGTASTQASTTVAVGIVVSQSPSGGTQTVTGSVVDIVVSSGVSVPAVVGLQQSAATTALTAAGLIVGTVTSQFSASVPAGAIISQSPAANSQASGGSAVNIVVSSGPAPAGPIVDGSVFSDGAGTRTTPAFNTTAAGDVLLAFASSDGPSTGTQTLTISGAGLTWSLVRRSNVRAGTSEIWQAKAVGQLTNVTVQSVQSAAGYRQSLTVVAFRGATGIGASAIANGASGAPSVSLTTTKANSLVYAVGNDWDRATARTLGSGQAMVHQWVDTVTGDTYWVQTRSAAATVGTTVQLNDTAPTADRWNFAGVEIVP